MEGGTTAGEQDYGHYRGKIIKKILATWLWDMVLYFYLNSDRANIFGTVMDHTEGGSHSRNT